MSVKRGADDFAFRRRRLTSVSKELRKVGDFPEQGAVGAARRRLHLLPQVLDLVALLGDQAAHELEMRFGVGVDVLFHHLTGTTETTAGVTEGTIDDSGRTRFHDCE